MDIFDNKDIKTEEEHTVVFPADAPAPEPAEAPAESDDASVNESGAADEGTALNGEVSDAAEPDPELTGIYAKLHDMDAKKMLKLQIVLGIFSGIICWAALRASSFLDSGDGILQWAFLIVFAVLMLGSNYLGRKAKLSITKFRLGLIIGLGTCIAVFAVVFFATGSGYGLIELLFKVYPA